jgi:signal transduction histidine kinase
VAVNAIPIQVYTCDRELRYTWVYNPLHDFRVEDLLGKRDDEILPPEAVAEVIAVKQQALATELGRIQEVKVRMNGEDRYFILATDPNRDPHGNVTGLTCSAFDITEQKRLEAEQREHHIQMEIQRRLLAYREQERQALALDLHDGPVQDLSSLLFSVQFAKEAITDPAVKVELDQIAARLKTTVQNLRETMNEMRPPSLIRFGLAKAMNVFLEEFRDHHPEIELDTSLMDDGSCLSEQARLSLYRILQEALTNAIKHSGTSKVAVSLICEDRQTVLEIRDQGKGFSLSGNLVNYSVRGHYGLVGMKERAEAISGSLAIDTEPGKGTTIRVIVPLV